MNIAAYTRQKRQIDRGQLAYDSRLPDDYYELPDDETEDPDESGEIWGKEE